MEDNRPNLALPAPRAKYFVRKTDPTLLANTLHLLLPAKRMQRTSRRPRERDDCSKRIYGSTSALLDIPVTFLPRLRVHRFPTQIRKKSRFLNSYYLLINPSKIIKIYI
jgi:hypothetical protein